MNDISTTLFPKRLLLATDLCQHCDRPLDRAKQLAAEWGARVTLLMVREGPGTPEEVASWLGGNSTVHAFELAARAEVAAEFEGSGVLANVQVARGDVGEGILRAAADLPDAIVIVGASRDETFQELLLGSTAARLAQDLVQPLLVVRQRTRGSYGRILVPNDFGSAARRALGTALELFPARRITLMHVLRHSAAGHAEASPAAVHAALEESERFLDQCALAAGARARIELVIGHGDVAEALARHAQAAATELVVLGVHRQSTLKRIMVGNISDQLLRQLRCDTLLVHAAGESGDD